MAGVETSSTEHERQWVESNRAVIDEALLWFMRSGEWPKVSELQRLFATRYQDLDVQAVADSKPKVPGETRAVYQESLTLAIRHLRYLPTAQPMIQICLTAARVAGRRYRTPDAELTISSQEPEIAAMAGGDGRLLSRAGSVLVAEQANPVSRAGTSEDGWIASINDRFVREYENVLSADDYVAIQNRLLAQFARQRGSSQNRLLTQIADLRATYQPGELHSPLPKPWAEGDDRPTETANEIFIVHGHSPRRQEVAAEIERMTGRPPIVLQEQPDIGSPTVIEKFEREARRAGYAVVIFSGDDEGRPRSTPDSQPQPRARQNVVAELGFFIGRLGRPSVKVLYEPGVEVPSDFGGILYLELDDAGTWRHLLAVELEAMGVPMSPSPSLQIVSARYGGGQTWRDVTHLLRDHIQDGRLQIPVANDAMGGDPIYLTAKTLIVQYRAGAQPIREVTVSEGKNLVLP